MDPFCEDVANKRPERLAAELADFQRTYANELETYLVARATAPGRTWNRDYSSQEAYLRSVEPNRRAWRDVLGHFAGWHGDTLAGCHDGAAPWPSPAGPAGAGMAMPPGDVATRPFHDGDDYRAEWVAYELLPGVVSRTVVAVPAGAPPDAPVVICQHGIGSSPFHIFGCIDPHDAYGAYGLALLRAGFAVVAPVNRTTGPGRNRLERIAHLCGCTLYGLECFKLERLIDYLATRDDLDAARLGMSGLSLGGMATLLFTPLIDRIRAACSMAWFNHRRRKMVVIDPRYSCFLATTEEHAFIPGWLPEFSDSDLASLICPRPFMVQTGKADGIAWWPFVLEEWAEAQAHYAKLGLADRAEMVLHDSGHEVVPSKVVAFFRKWL